MDFYAGKKVLVTGGTGMIGRELVQLLLQRGAIVRTASLDDSSSALPGTEFVHADLTHPDSCAQACLGQEMVFHLAGIKGSPKMMKEQPASYFVPSLLFTTHMMEAARKAGVRHFLFTSSVGVYAPAEVFREDDVLKSLPSPNDLFGGWHKRTGELQAQAYATQYGWNTISIVRPANVYGSYDNFDPENAMVIPSLIHRAMSGEDPLVVWGDGSAIRDFIHARDVARGMLLVVEKGYNLPVNLGSGTGYSIKELVEVIVSHLEKKPRIVWDATKPGGDRKRLMDISRAQALGWNPQMPLQEGIKKVMEWYLKNKNTPDTRYNVFTKAHGA